MRINKQELHLHWRGKKGGTAHAWLTLLWIYVDVISYMLYLRGHWHMGDFWLFRPSAAMQDITIIVG